MMKKCDLCPENKFSHIPLPPPTHHIPPLGSVPHDVLQLGLGKLKITAKSSKKVPWNWQGSLWKEPEHLLSSKAIKTEPQGEERLLGHEQLRGKTTGTQIKSLKRLGTLRKGSVEMGGNARTGIWNCLRGSASHPNTIPRRVWDKND